MRGLETAYLDMKTLDLKDKEQVTTLGIRQQFGVRAVVSAEEGGSELSEEFLEMQRRLELRVLLQQQQQHCQYEAGTRQQKGAGADAQRAGRGQSAPGGDASSTSSSWKEESDALAPLVSVSAAPTTRSYRPRPQLRHPTPAFFHVACIILARAHRGCFAANLATPRLGCCIAGLRRLDRRPGQSCSTVGYLGGSWALYLALFRSMPNPCSKSLRSRRKSADPGWGRCREGWSTPMRGGTPRREGGSWPTPYWPGF